jgi:serine/threonine protein kinase
VFAIFQGVPSPAMQSPLLSGTLLQNRYYLVEILGRGGFARTYLAQDQDRFDELCVLKELIPSQHNKIMLEKSRELFQREAAILYQIRHPQIPQFRATFEINDPDATRLFLVQDYVAGKTYRQLLSDRKAEGLAFSEAEVRELMEQLLPVLDHLHSRGIIHRDISPENLILRQSDRLPVLIDFGVVKEIVNRLNADSLLQGTAVGKLGFAPIEQLQTGRSYPSSDLYSLAVTAVVLLTGQEPQSLFEDQTASWNWQNFTQVKPEFAQVLNQMLDYRPGDRFQSAQEVIQAMQILPPAITVPTQIALEVTTANNFSQVQTTAEKHPIGLISANHHELKSYEPETLLPQGRTHKSLWENFWFLMGLALMMLATTGSIAWTIFKQMGLLNRGLPNMPIVMGNPSPTQSPQSPSVVGLVEDLSLKTGVETIVAGNLKNREIYNYRIRGQQQQILQAKLSEATSDKFLLSLLVPTPKPVKLAEDNLAQGFQLRSTGQYILQLQLRPGIPQGDYQLAIALNNQGVVPPSAVPTTSPSPSLPATTNESRPSSGTLVAFVPGEELKEIRGQLRARQTKRYLVNVKDGKVLSAVVVNGFVSLNIRTPEGRLVGNGGKVMNWESRVYKPGTYQVDVIGMDDTKFVLKLGVR